MNGKSGVLLAPWHKRTLYGVATILWLSGALWLYFHYFGQTQGNYGPQNSALLSPTLKIHGAAAMAFLIALGSLLTTHVPLGWRQKIQRPSGASLLTASAVLILSGWGLYYIGQDQWREWTSAVHSMIGLLFPLMIVAHVSLRRGI